MIRAVEAVGLDKRFGRAGALDGLEAGQRAQD